MAQREVSGAFSVTVDVDRLAAAITDRIIGEVNRAGAGILAIMRDELDNHRAVMAGMHARLTLAQGGQDAYVRDPEPAVPTDLPEGVEGHALGRAAVPHQQSGADR